MDKRRLLIAVRLLFGFLVLAAAIIQAVSLQQAGVFDPINYLSYFTNLSNILAATIFIISTGYLIKRRPPTKTDDIIRGASVLYMAVTGVVYVSLLSGIEVSLQIPWINILLHYIMPVVVVIDWLYQPQKNQLSFSNILSWLLFPAAYLIYSLLRGAYIGWYPYPFLNPASVGGYGNVALYCAGILIVFLVLGILLMKLGNAFKRHV
ncbi:MAG TPA: Pr6Pr family membrane protein [Candidatus Saccharimonadales bacterium]